MLQGTNKASIPNGPKYTKKYVWLKKVNYLENLNLIYWESGPFSTDVLIQNIF